MRYWIWLSNTWLLAKSYRLDYCDVFDCSLVYNWLINLLFYPNSTFISLYNYSTSSAFFLSINNYSYISINSSYQTFCFFSFISIIFYNCYSIFYNSKSLTFLYASTIFNPICCCFVWWFLPFFEAFLYFENTYFCLPSRLALTCNKYCYPFLTFKFY